MASFSKGYWETIILQELVAIKDLPNIPFLGTVLVGSLIIGTATSTDTASAAMG